MHTNNDDSQLKNYDLAEEDSFCDELATPNERKQRFLKQLKKELKLVPNFEGYYNSIYEHIVFMLSRPCYSLDYDIIQDYLAKYKEADYPSPMRFLKSISESIIKFCKEIMQGISDSLYTYEEAQRKLDYYLFTYDLFKRFLNHLNKVNKPKNHNNKYLSKEPKLLSDFIIPKSLDDSLANIKFLTLEEDINTKPISYNNPEINISDLEINNVQYFNENYTKKSQELTLLGRSISQLQEITIDNDEIGVSKLEPKDKEILKEILFGNNKDFNEEHLEYIIKKRNRIKLYDQKAEDIDESFLEKNDSIVKKLLEQRKKSQEDNQITK